MKSVLITGSSGLIGSEVATFFHKKGFLINGIDNNQRAVFLGSAGDTRWCQIKLSNSLHHFCHHELDIRDRTKVLDLVQKLQPSCIIHTAAQTSHDRATEIPFDDFDTNATGTLNILEAARRYCPESPFIYMSSNKVYGDRPNSIPLVELPTRWDFHDPVFADGIPESFPIDQSMHSLFGASKLSGDIMVQEYGRYFNMPTCCLRGGCLTGPNHSGVELHGFISYLIKCNLEGREYNIYGYKGKQVRDNIHSEDVASFIHAFYNNPRCAEVYNIGGGKSNSCSILEAFSIVEKYSGKSQLYSYIDQNRIGDHICYYSDLSKIRNHFPEWELTKTLEQTIEEIVMGWHERLKSEKKGPCCL